MPQKSTSKKYTGPRDKDKRALVVNTKDPNTGLIIEDNSMGGCYEGRVWKEGKTGGRPRHIQEEDTYTE